MHDQTHGPCTTAHLGELLEFLGLAVIHGVAHGLPLLEVEWGADRIGAAIQDAVHAALSTKHDRLSAVIVCVFVLRNTRYTLHAAWPSLFYTSYFFIF